MSRLRSRTGCLTTALRYGDHPIAINSAPAHRPGRFEADIQALARPMGFNPPGC